jgi:signal recognition particle receptor subunit beta
MRAVGATAKKSAKLLVAGPVGAGKTTLVAAVSEIEPLRTEELLTQASSGVDALDVLSDKTTTTVLLDFGRLTLDGIVLCLFGMPGQPRFWGIWDAVAEGAIGALVLVDLRYLAKSFAVLDQLDQRRTPYIVVINDFPNTQHHTDEDVRKALDLPPEIVLLRGDARRRDSSIAALIALVGVAITQLQSAEASK